MTLATPRFYMDFNRTGSFVDDADKEVTSYVTEYDISLGKSKDFIERYVVGTCALKLKNTDGWWSGKNFGGVDGSGQVTGFRTTLANNQPAVDSDVFFATSGANARYAQSFVHGAGRWVDRGDARLRRTGSPGGTVKAYFYRNAASLPEFQLSAYAVSKPIDISSISTSYEWVKFEFEKAVALRPNVTYWMVLVPTGYTRAAGTAELSWGANGAVPYVDGAPATFNSTTSTWSAVAGGADFKFRITGNDIELRALTLWVTQTKGADTDYRFYGQLARWSVNPNPAVNEAILTFADPMKEMEKSPLNLTTLHQNRYLAHESEASMLGDVLTAAGYSSSNWSIGSELLRIPFAVYPRMTQGEAVAKITEAGGGFFFFQATSAAAGYVRPTYRSSNYENLTAAAESWGSGVLLNGPETSLEQEERQLSTQLIVMVNPRQVEPKIADVWEYKCPIRFSSLQQMTLWAELRDACTDLVTLESGVDYTAGFTINTFIKYPGSARAKIVLTAPSGGATLSKLKIRGRPVTSVDQFAVQIDSADGQGVTETADGTGIVSPSRLDNEFIQTQELGEQIGTKLLERNVREPTWLTVSRSGNDATMYPSLINRMVGDIVSIEFPTTAPGTNIGVDGDYMIESISESGRATDGSHVVTYRLREVGRAATRRFQYGAAGLGYSQGAVLGP